MKKYLYGIYLIVFFFLCIGFAPSGPRRISYVPDFNLADQGAAVGLSIKNIIDATDPNRQITINLVQASGYLDENTPYHVSTNLTIPSNITLEIESGAYIDGNATLTINGPFKAELIKCFAPSFDVVFGDGSITEIYVEWFGGAGDDSTDNYYALNKSLSVSSILGVPVELGSGIYRTSQAGKILMGSNSSLIGRSRDKTVIYKTVGGTSGAGRVIENENYGSSYDENIIIKNLTVKGTYQSASSDYEHNHCIGFYKARNVLIENCYLYDAGGDGISGRLVDYIEVKNCEINNCGRNGISPTAGKWIIEGCNIHNITGDNGPGAGIDGEPDNTSEPLDIVIRKNFVDPDGGNCIALADLHTDPNVSDLTMISGSIENNEVGINYGAHRGIYVKATNAIRAQNINISNNRVIGCNNGIEIDEMDGVVIENNYIDNSGGSGYGIYINADYLKIKENHIVHDAQYTIGDAFGRTGNVIENNYSYGRPTLLKNSTYCVYTGNYHGYTTGMSLQGASCVDNLITGNNFTACTTSISATSSGDLKSQFIFNNIGYSSSITASYIPPTILSPWEQGSICVNNGANPGESWAWIKMTSTSNFRPLEPIRYYVNPSAVSQSDPNEETTIANYLGHIGTTRPATIILRYVYYAAPTYYTNYNIDDNLIITSNIEFEMELGARIDPNSAGSLTINGPFKGWNGCFPSGYSVNIGAKSIAEIFNYGPDTAADDDYVITVSSPYNSYVKGMHFYFDANNPNTGACTANFNSWGAKSIKILHDQDPGDNCIEEGSMVHLIYDGTNFQMINPCAN